MKLVATFLAVTLLAGCEAYIEPSAETYGVSTYGDEPTFDVGVDPYYNHYPYHNPAYSGRYGRQGYHAYHGY